MNHLLELWPLALFALLAFVFVRLLRPPAPPQPPPYEKRGSLLTPAEQQFYHALNAAVGDRFAICPMVRISELLQVRKEAADRGAWQGRINSKHIDFVLCDPQSLSPRACIELDDATHEQPERQARDAFLNESFAAAGLPLLRVMTAKLYDARQLNEAINAALG
jgi:very-short-patch-repair endonuclease